MPESRIVAVDHVHLESRPEVETALRWFYGELVALDEVTSCSQSGTRLVFKSARIELRIKLTEQADIDPVDCRVAILVPSLKDVTDVLDDEKIAFETISGLRWSDRRITLFDPGGNRIVLRQYWPFFVL